MSLLLDIGVSGLLAQQSKLQTTGQNITNADVEGYSRREVDLQTRDERFTSGGYIGTGVEIETIRRVTNDLLTRQSLTSTSRFEELEVLNTGLDQLDTLLSNEATGLASSINSFFASLQAVSETPSSFTLRQDVINKANSFAQSYQTLHDEIQSLLQQTDVIIESGVSEINELTSAIANLNTEIFAANGVSSGDRPNELLDQRDILLNKLSEKISFTSVIQDGVNINLYTASGTALVVGSEASQLLVLGNNNTTQGRDVGIKVGNITNVVTDDINGGALGGAIRLRDEGVDEAFNQIGLVHTLLSSALNVLHAEGVDLNGNAGGNLFIDINDRTSQLFRVAPSIKNQSSDAIVSVAIEDPGDLIPSDYKLEINNTGSLLGYTVTRLKDGVIVDQNAVSQDFPRAITVDGFSIQLENGNLNSGDVFILSPTRVPPESVELLVQDPSALALGLPISTSESSTNSGNGRISQVSALTIENTEANQDAETLTFFREQTPPLLIKFTSPTTFDVLDNSDSLFPVSLDPPLRNLTYIPGVSNQILDYSTDTQFLANSYLTVPSVGTIGTTTNRYFGETVTVTRNLEDGTQQIQNVSLIASESAGIAAARLNNVEGIRATANTSMSFTVTDDNTGPPLQLRLNGIDLVSSADGPVPSPITVDFLAGRINQLFSNSGVTANVTGSQLNIRSLTGEDLIVENYGAGADFITVSERNGAALAPALRVDAGEETNILGTVDVVFDSDLQLSSTGGFFGSSTAEPLNIFVGYNVEMSGAPQAGDEFTVTLGQTGPGDNRNAQALAALESADILRLGNATVSEVYASAVGSIGSNSARASVDRDAAESLLIQTKEKISSISGVNLDEEAAKLLQYEQAYNASARIISVARSVFDSLIAAFS